MNIDINSERVLINATHIAWDCPELASEAEVAVASVVESYLDGNDDRSDSADELEVAVLTWLAERAGNKARNLEMEAAAATDAAQGCGDYALNLAAADRESAAWASEEATAFRQLLV